MPSKAKIKAAYSELEKIRAEYPGVSEDKLPEEVLRRGLAAARIIRAGPRPIGAPLVLFLVLVVAAVFALLMPITYVSCVAAPGVGASCIVEERPLGFIPWRTRYLPSAASASGSIASRRQETTDSSGKRKTQTISVQNLSLYDAEGRVLWEYEGSHIMGANLEAFGKRIEGLIRREIPGPVHAGFAAWPALLFVTLMNTLVLLALISMAWPWWAPSAIKWVCNAFILLAGFTPWIVLLTGSDIPTWLVRILRLGIWPEMGPAL